MSLTACARPWAAGRTLVDETAKDQDTLALLRWLDESQQADKLFENQQLLRQPIVRNGRAATVGYRPEVWRSGNEKLGVRS